MFPERGGARNPETGSPGPDIAGQQAGRLRGQPGADFQLRAAGLGVFGLQTGAAYSQKGASEASGGDEVAIELDYIEVPLLLTVSPAAEPAAPLSVPGRDSGLRTLRLAGPLARKNSRPRWW